MISTRLQVFRHLSRLLSCKQQRAYTNDSYVHGANGLPKRFETIGHRLQRCVESDPDREFLVFRGQNIRKTYAHFYEDARKMAAGLISLGLEKGDRVGVWGQNYYEWCLIQYATAMAGLIQVNINPFYKADELQYALLQVGVKVLVTPKEYKQNKYWDTLLSICPTIGKGEAGVGVHRDRKFPELKHIIVFGEDKPVEGAWSFQDIFQGGGTQHVKLLEAMEGTVVPDQPVNIQYTSGTTGYPKAATLTHFNILNNSYFTGLGSKWHEATHRICIPNPLYHCFGCVMGVMNALNHNQTCVFPEIGYDTVKTFEAIDQEKCTFLFGTPTMFIDLLSHPKLKEFDVSSLTGGYIAGAPCPLSLCQSMVKELNMHDIYVLYGSTELSPVVTMSSSSEPPEKRIQSVGNVMPATEIVIVDEEGKVVKRGEKGELLARGYMVMRGYWNDEERTKKEITPDGWYHTGDTASMNADGTINIVGRSKDMIVKGGENIYPTEIEQFIFKQPYIADVQVVGVPDERYGENVCAWIRLKPDYIGRITEETIKDVCKNKIAHYKVPKYVLIKEQKDFPLTATGKVKKFELRTLSTKLLGLEHVKSHFNS